MSQEIRNCEKCGKQYKKDRGYKHRDGKCADIASPELSEKSFTARETVVAQDVKISDAQKAFETLKSLPQEFREFFKERL